ncbi:HAD-IC family P-type ATPase [Ralstonia sp. UBA689]|uniref:HAD-IC family P-type ATPase n=1 Tax=Ralstonia sp. UBA689 TaxID=1947373 RepID=UPI0025D4201C|nr:HAD-IC family P-type ATPase [Ralstonia sp. UBA689]
MSDVAAMREAASEGLSAAEARARLLRDGPNEVEPAPTHPLRRLAARFWGLSAWMLESIAVLSLVLHKLADFWVSLALLLVNAILGSLQEQRASSAVASLRRQMQVSARALRDGAWVSIAARELVRGDIVRVRAGDFVPADLRLIEGELSIDQSALTGESREVHKQRDDEVHSGSIVRRGEATAEVRATGTATYFGRTTHLVDSAQPRLHVEAVVSRVVKWLFLIVGAQVAVVAGLALARHGLLVDILPLSLVLLMSAVPVALPVMFTVSMSLGALELGKQGVLITRLSAAEDAANMDILCADKTGTLTMNRLSWAGALPQPGFTEEDVLRYGAMASNEADQDTIDLAFLRGARERGWASVPQSRFVPFSAQTRRTEAVVVDRDTAVHVVKGAVATIAGLAGLDDEARARLDTYAAQAAAKGHRVLAVARGQGGQPLELVGLALLNDIVRADSKALIAELHALGVGVKMITGDAASVAKEVAHTLGVTDVSAEVLPEGKFRIVQDLQSAGHVVGMTGDGVNDAPALRQAEVGIAVSSATDVAKGAASVVLTREGLTSVVDLVRTGRSIYQRVLTWIINKVSRTILKSGFVSIAFVATGHFVISALGMVLLVFMTDFVKIALSTDRVSPSAQPVTWNIAPLLKAAALLGVLMLVEALGLLAFAWQRFGLDANAGARSTFAFEVLLFFALFSIVSIRERRAFWASWPSWQLAAALIADACVGLVIGLYGLGELQPLPASQVAFIAGYALVISLLVNDAVKRVLMR